MCRSLHKTSCILDARRTSRHWPVMSRSRTSGFGLIPLPQTLSEAVAEWTMNSRIRAVSLFVAAVLSSCARQPAVRVVAADEGPGLIEGTVIYEDGRPSKGATVSAFPLDRALAARVPSPDTHEL